MAVLHSTDTTDLSRLSCYGSRELLDAVGNGPNAGLVPWPGSRVPPDGPRLVRRFPARTASYAGSGES